ncbi:flavodoxin family protein [candidate division KSB3 bacterium]|uniref:Flavodoxin family protein n=1 Tax=candidate division KSB3 bacterium TaxID=2044937 RepID=A0A9D5Q3V2_9BACT|nr:flavodoxin family protein [candidate division KSB3 bacterium]MBD3323039.1 flavodoxin family protein [candidate division KSB3 bacterium]
MGTSSKVRWQKGIEDFTPEPGHRVLGISGSPRKHGNSDTLLAHVLAGVNEEQLPTATVPLRDYQFESCIGCEQCRKDRYCSGLKDGMHLIYPEIIGCQGLVVVSPTYNYNITSWMKAFIDRLYCFYEFNNERPRGWRSHLANQNRKALIVAVCEQEDPKDMGFTVDAMRLPLEALGYDIQGELAAFQAFEKGAVKRQQQVLDEAFTLGKQLAVALRAEAST